MGSLVVPSMKVPPKRKGNGYARVSTKEQNVALNESPSEKEGKLENVSIGRVLGDPSMKVPPKRKGNVYFCCASFRGFAHPQ